jgi:hypothetical protein
VTSSRDLDWVVVIATPGDFRPRELAQVLAKARGIPLADAAMAVRRAGGILLERASRADAEALVALLAREGIAAKAGYCARRSESDPPAVWKVIHLTGLGHGLTAAPSWGHTSRKGVRVETATNRSPRLPSA